MGKYISLLRGINVGGNNIIKMADLKAAFERKGFQNVSTYIGSGNILFDSTLNETAIKDICEVLIAEDFGLDIPACVISTVDLIDALSHAPDWWNKAPDARHELGAAAYAILAVMATSPEKEREITRKQEYRWQRDRLPGKIRELVLDDQRLRNELCWSVFYSEEELT